MDRPCGQLLGAEYRVISAPAGVWKALEEAKKEGKLKSIGVSNMTPRIWKEYIPKFEMLPAVNQVE